MTPDICERSPNRATNGSMDVRLQRPTTQPQSWYSAELFTARARYLRDWTIVKRARFNAAKRFERKHDASTLAFALAGVVGIALPFYTQLFGPALAPHTKSVLEFYGYITGALSLGLGLVEQAKGYESRSRRFDECGRRVNAIVRKLRNNPTLDEVTLDEMVREYERAIDICDVNHDAIDHDIALAEEDREAARAHGETEQRTASSRVQRLRAWETFGIYWLYGVVLVGPTLLAMLIWWLLGTPSA
jgi:exonuclease VII small subunit